MINIFSNPTAPLALHTTEQLNAALAGRYVIERRVGEGGMATVFLARDIKHNRRVALKVLKPDLGAVVGVERFLSEIEVTANLQHPNLLPLFDSGVADGLLFYVMPFVEGESLRARLDREKQLPIDDAIQLATAVASALDYAHRRGVIHRDLKPENILMHEGQPLVADFGIALAVSNAGGHRITQTGLSLGTPQYMSPEQATGDRAIDARTDVYSLGAVTYEMLAGEPPHTGSTSQAIIARVLTEKPRSLRVTRPNVMPHVETAVEHALEKLPADRFTSAREFADALTGKIVVPTTAHAAAEERRTSRERLLLVALAAAIVLWGVTTVIAIRRSGRVAGALVGRFEVETRLGIGQLQLSVSPDGRNVVFNENQPDGRSALVLRPLAVRKPSVIKGTEGASAVTFWSPDSRQLAFVNGAKLKRVAIATGDQQVICDLPGVFGGGTWNDARVIVFSSAGTIYSVPASGGMPIKVPLHALGAGRWDYPVFLPDGDHFLVLGRGGTDSSQGVYVASLRSGSATRLVAAETRAGFVPPNHLLFVRDEVLYAQDLELDGPRLVGDPVEIADDVGMNVGNGAAGFAAAADVVVAREVGTRFRQLKWFGRDGKLLETLGDSAIYVEIALSPDGKHIAATVGARSEENGQDIRVIDVGSRISSLLVAGSVPAGGVMLSPDSRVLWSPDSRAVTFHNGARIRIKSVGGITDSLVYASRDSLPVLAEDYTGHGDTLLIKRGDTLFALPMTGDRKPMALPAVEGIHEVRLSPDGKQIAYWRSESNGGQVYVASYPALDNRRQISATGGIQPRWRQDGKELYFIEPGNGNVMMVSVKPGSPGEFTGPAQLFKGPLQGAQGFLDQWDVTRDGQRFLFAAPLNQVNARPLMVVLNWRSLLPKK